MTSSIRRRLALAGVMAIALVSLTGCFKVAMNLDVNSDDTMDGAIIFAVDKQYAGLAGDQALSGAGLNPSDLASLGADATTKPYDDGTYVGQEIDFTGAPLSALSQSMGSGTTGDTFSLTHTNGQFVFDATMDMSGGLGNLPGGSSSSDAMTQALLDSASFTVSLTFPGAVTDTNGSVEGNTVTWKLDLTGPNTLHAVAGDQAPGMSAGIWIGVALTVLLLAGLWFLGWRARGGPDADNPEPAGPPETPDAGTRPVAEAPTEELRPPAGPTG